MKDIKRDELGRILKYVVVPYAETEIEGETHVKIYLEDLEELFNEMDPQTRQEVLDYLNKKYGRD